MWLCFGHIWQWERSGKLSGSTLWCHKFEMEVCFCISARNIRQQITVQKSAFSVCSASTGVGGPRPFIPSSQRQSLFLMCSASFSLLLTEIKIWGLSSRFHGLSIVEEILLLNLKNFGGGCLLHKQISQHSSFSYSKFLCRSCTFHTWGGIASILPALDREECVPDLHLYPASWKMKRGSDIKAGNSHEETKTNDVTQRRSCYRGDEFLMLCKG